MSRDLPRIRQSMNSRFGCWEAPSALRAEEDSAPELLRRHTAMYRVIARGVSWCRAHPVARVPLWIAYASSTGLFWRGFGQLTVNCGNRPLSAFSVLSQVARLVGKLGKEGHDLLSLHHCLVMDAPCWNCNQIVQYDMSTRLIGPQSVAPSAVDPSPQRSMMPQTIRTSEQWLCRHMMCFQVRVRHSRYLLAPTPPHRDRFESRSESHPACFDASEEVLHVAM